MRQLIVGISMVVALVGCGKESRVDQVTGPAGSCSGVVRFLHMPACGYRGDYCLAKVSEDLIEVGLDQVQPGGCGFDAFSALVR